MGKRKHNAASTPYGQSFAKRTKNNNLLALSSHIQHHAAKIDLTAQQQRTAQANKAKQHSKQALRHAIVPYTACQNILLIGEGDFSFARSLLTVRRSQHGSAGSTCAACTRHHSIVDSGEHKCGYNITATAYDSASETTDKYSTAEAHIDALLQSDATVMYDVDCTKLHQRGLFEHHSSNDTTDADQVQSSSLREHIDKLQRQIAELDRTVNPTNQFDRIVFLFPHTGSGEKDTVKNNAQHTALVTQFLQSVAQSYRLLKPTTQHSEIHIVLKNGEPYSDWHIDKCGRQVAGMTYIGRQPFHPHLYTGYRHVKTSASHTTTDNGNAGNEFLSVGCTLYRFGRVQTAQDRRDARRREASVVKMNELRDKLETYQQMLEQGVDITIDDDVDSTNERAHNDDSGDESS